MPPAAFSTFICGRAGQVTAEFTVDSQHGTADASLVYKQSIIALFAVGGTFDLQITVGARVALMAACAVTAIEPDPHSDQSSVIKYAFTGSTYTITT